MARIGATLLVWAMFTAIVIALMTSATGAITNASGSEAFGIIVAIAAATAISTAAIWSGSRSDEDDESMSRSLAKSKRRRARRAEDILDALDDEEVYDLEALLLSRERKSRQPPS